MLQGESMFTTIDQGGIMVLGIIMVIVTIIITTNMVTVEGGNKTNLVSGKIELILIKWYQFI